MRTKKLAIFIATGALVIGLTACTASVGDGTSKVEQSGGGSDTSIDISPTVSGDEKVDLGNIDTGNNNSTDGNG
jgi:hypothetical protein